MRLIDTHSHVYAEEFSEDILQVEARAKEAGVSHILLPNIDATSIESLRNLFSRNTKLYKPMMGLHPTSVKEDWKMELERIERELNSYPYIAVGEIGIDLYWDQTYKQEQIEAFETQLVWSAEKNIPVSIHSRSAHREVMDSIRKVGERRLRGVFHSFGGNPSELEEVLSFSNFYIGINGAVTFKNAQLPDTLQKCPLERVVLETDAPYLAPTPNRGKRNEPAYLQSIAHKLSEIYRLDVEKIGDATSRNAEILFGIN